MKKGYPEKRRPRRGQTGRGQNVWTDFAERKGIPDRRREQITSRRDHMLRNVASTSDANLQAKEAIAD